MQAKKLNNISIAEYLRIEAESACKYEYHDGRIFAMAGGSVNHGLLCGNVYVELVNGLRRGKSNCKAVNSEVKLHIERQNSYVYPDAMVICGKMEEVDMEGKALKNPTLIVEVLSKSTADYDRGEKFYKYRQIPTLQEYVLIGQDKAVVEVFYKKPDADLWKITRYAGLDDTVVCQSLSLTIRMADLYFDIVGVE